MSKLTFRDYRPEDYPEVYALWVALEMTHPDRGDTSRVINDTLAAGGKLILICLPENGKIIGTSWITFDGRRLFLHHFCIAGEFQGKGYGTELAVVSMDFIRKKGYPVKLEVRSDNLVARHLYEKLGFFAFTDYEIYMFRP